MYTGLGFSLGVIITATLAVALSNYEFSWVFSIITGIFKVMHIIGVKCEYGVRGKTRVLILNGKEYKL